MKFAVRALSEEKHIDHIVDHVEEIHPRSSLLATAASLINEIKLACKIVKENFMSTVFVL